MTRHASIQAMLARRDRLDPEDEARVAAHLEACPECRERAIDYAGQIAFLRSFRRETAPSVLRDGLRTIVDQRIAASGAQSHTDIGGQISRDPTRGAWRVLPPGRTRTRLRWPGVALAAVVAIAVAVLSPTISQRTVAPASAEQLLRSAAQTAQAMPSSGAATITYLGSETNLLPDRVVPHRLLETWSATDDQHYRTEVQTVEPAIDSGTLTTIQDGSSMTRYDTRTETASVWTEPASFHGGFSLADGAPMGDVGPDQSIQQYLDSTQQDLPSSVPHFARIVAKAQLLGRQVDVVQFAPVVRGIQCVPRGGTWTDCNTPLDFGAATVWIDDATHVVLKYEANLANPHSMVRTTIFQVTSFTAGQGATQAQLSERPPVPVQSFRHDSIGTSGRSAPPGLTVQVPHGFLPAPAPSELQNATSDMEVVTTLPLGDATAINVLFNPNAKLNFRYDYAPGDHSVLVEERIRVHGLPVELQTATPTQAGTCPAWSGTSADGLHTLAFARGAISVILTSNSLSAGDLASYAAGTMCR